MTKKPFQVLLIGPTGKWAEREIWPSIFANFLANEFAPGTVFLALARKLKKSDGTETTCLYEFRDWLKSFLPNQNLAKLESFLEKVYFYAGEATQENCWHGLREFSRDKNFPENLTVMMSTPPSVYVPTLKAMRTSGYQVPQGNRDISRVLMLEKPFGRNSEECSVLFDESEATFGKACYFPTDHYSTKRMKLELSNSRRNNPRFFGTYSYKFIKEIIILADECDNLDERHHTYQSMGMGAFADMVLGHLLPQAVWMAMNKDCICADATYELVGHSQMLLLGGMTVEPLAWGQYDDGKIGDLNVRAYQSLGDESYRITPTFSALKVQFQRGPLRGVPIYIRTGKGLRRKHNETRIVYKVPYGADSSACETCIRFINHYDDGSNVLTDTIMQEDLRRQPKLGFDLSLVQTRLTQPGSSGDNGFRPYQKLILSAMTGHFNDFPFPESIVSLYQKCEKIWEDYLRKYHAGLDIHGKKGPILQLYKAGSSGPEVTGFPKY